MDGGMGGGYWGDVGRGMTEAEARGAASALAMGRALPPPHFRLAHHMMQQGGLGHGDDASGPRSPAEQMQQLHFQLRFAAQQQQRMAAMLPFGPGAHHGGNGHMPFFGVPQPPMAPPRTSPARARARAPPAPRQDPSPAPERATKAPPAAPKHVPRPRKPEGTSESEVGDAGESPVPAALRDRLRTEGYDVEVLSQVAGLRFARNNGRNSKNIQGFPHLPDAPSPSSSARGATRRRRRVHGLRARVTCPSLELLKSAIVTMSIVPDSMDAGSAWWRHECQPGTRECDTVPVFMGTPEEPRDADSDGEFRSGARREWGAGRGAGGAAHDGGVDVGDDGVASRVFVFHPRHVWWYNHAMKKNLGARRELHCLKFAVFQQSECTYRDIGATFELANKKRDQMSRKKRLIVGRRGRGSSAPRSLGSHGSTSPPPHGNAGGAGGVYTAAAGLVATAAGGAGGLRPAPARTMGAVPTAHGSQPDARGEATSAGRGTGGGDAASGSSASTAPPVSPSLQRVSPPLSKPADMAPLMIAGSSEVGSGGAVLLPGARGTVVHHHVAPGAMGVHGDARLWGRRHADPMDHVAVVHDAAVVCKHCRVGFAVTRTSARDMVRQHLAVCQHVPEPVREQVALGAAAASAAQAWYGATHPPKFGTVAHDAAGREAGISEVGAGRGAQQRQGRSGKEGGGGRKALKISKPPARKSRAAALIAESSTAAAPVSPSLSAAAEALASLRGLIEASAAAQPSTAATDTPTSRLETAATSSAGADDGADTVAGGDGETIRVGDSAAHDSEYEASVRRKRRSRSRRATGSGTRGTSSKRRRKR